MSTTVTGRGVRFWMDMLATVAAVGGCGLLIWLNWSRLFPDRPSVPSAPVSLDGATLRGNPQASVVVLEFSDYMCPFCVRFENEVLPELSKQHVEGGQVQWAFRHLPLERLHPGASKASEAALCAGHDGKFWEMHAALFLQPKGLDTTRLLDLGREMGLDASAYEPCLLEGHMAQQVQFDLELANSLGITGTPAFLVGIRQSDGRLKVVEVIDGARSIDVYEKAIASAASGRTQNAWWFVATGIVAVVGGGLAFSRQRLRLRHQQREEVKTT